MRPRVLAHLEHQNIPPLFILHHPVAGPPVLAEKLILGKPWNLSLREQAAKRIEAPHQSACGIGSPPFNPEPRSPAGRVPSAGLYS